jgi:DNA-binding NarL/FixJ family response regulator
MIDILIVDDHAIVRQGLKQIMATEPDFLVAGEAGAVPEALDLVRKRRWDAVILDIGLPGRSGLEALSDIKKEHPRLPVLILSMYSDEQFAVRALRAGASGYLSKACAPEELVTALRKILRGEKYVSPGVAEKLVLDLTATGDRPLHETLSDREYEVLRLIASGKTVSEIAVRMSLSVKTISTYRARILKKMRMKTNAELTHYAVISRLVD